MNSRQKSKFDMLQGVIQFLEFKPHLMSKLPNLCVSVENLRRVVYEIGEIDNFFILSTSSEPTFNHNLRAKKAQAYRTQRRNLFKLAKEILTKSLDVKVSSLRKAFPMDYHAYSLARQLHDSEIPYSGQVRWQLKPPHRLESKKTKPFTLTLRGLAS